MPASRRRPPGASKPCMQGVHSAYLTPRYVLSGPRLAPAVKPVCCLTLPTHFSCCQRAHLPCRHQRRDTRSGRPISVAKRLAWSGRTPSPSSHSSARSPVCELSSYGGSIVCLRRLDLCSSCLLWQECFQVVLPRRSQQRRQQITESRHCATYNHTKRLVSTRATNKEHMHFLVE